MQDDRPSNDILGSVLLLTTRALSVPDDQRNGDTAEVPSLDCSPVRV